MDGHPKQMKQKDKKSQNQQSGKLKGSPRDDPKTRISKTLSYVLRHGAEKEGITIRPDGFVLVNDLVGKSLLLTRRYPQPILFTATHNSWPNQSSGNWTS